MRVNVIVRVNIIVLARNLVDGRLLSERGVDAIDPETLRSVGHAAIEAGTSTLKAGRTTLSCLLLGRCCSMLLCFLRLGGASRRGLANNDLVLDGGLHRLLLGRSFAHCKVSRLGRLGDMVWCRKEAVMFRLKTGQGW